MSGSLISAEQDRMFPKQHKQQEQKHLIDIEPLHVPGIVISPLHI